MASFLDFEGKSMELETAIRVSQWRESWAAYSKDLCHNGILVLKLFVAHCDY